jgi:hypothetical protein
LSKFIVGLSALLAVLAISAAASGTVKRLITGRDIANGSIGSVDITNHTIAAKDLKTSLVRSLRGRRGLRGARGARGAIGATGATGAAGATGTAGANAFDKVPSGKTIHGVVGLDVDADSAAKDWGVLASMSMPGTAVLGDGDVFVNVSTWTDLGGNTAPTTTDSDPGCTGTIATPTAPAAKVCIYVDHADNADDLKGYGVDSNQGFKLNFTNLGIGDSFVDAVWAYTAP